MPIKVGTTDIKIPFSKAYVGEDLVYQTAAPGPTLVNYLESSGTQYIHLTLPYPMAIDVDSYEADFQYTSPNDFTGAVYGGSYIAGRTCFGSWLSIDGQTTKFTLSYGASGRNWNTIAFQIADQNRHAFKTHVETTGDIYFDDTESYVSSCQKVSEVSLFTNYSINAGVGSIGHIRIYSFKIKNGATGDYVYDLVPALDSNNVPCFYDRVSDEFVYNAGTGTFLYG